MHVLSIYSLPSGAMHWQLQPTSSNTKDRSGPLLLTHCHYVNLSQAPNIRRALDGELYFYGKTLGFPVSMPDGLAPPDIVNVAA